MASRYRENPSRAIFLTEEIDQRLVAKISPEIVRLRLQSAEPIFLYIDSLGGSTFYAEKLLRLMRAPDQTGKTCEVVSVAIGFAASAAADLLALADYAIAYPNAMIHYHGTRQSKDEISLEDVKQIADSLRETNEAYALRLASRVFKRLVFRMLTLALEKSTAETGQFTIAEGVANPHVFFDQLSQRVGGKPKEILACAVERQKKLTELVSVLTKNAHITAAGNEINLNADVQLLKGIIDFEASRLKESATDCLNLESLTVIQDDFIQLNDFFHGRYKRTLQQIVFERGLTFLAVEEMEEYKTISPEEPARQNKFLIEKVAPRLNPLWHLVVSICRILQEGENGMTPTDAYWLGLVNEVVGSNLMNERTLEEELSKPPPEEKSTH